MSQFSQPRRSLLRNAALLLLAFACPGLARAAELSSADTADLMAKLHQHRRDYPALTADFAEQKTSHLLQQPLTSSGTLSFQSPNKFRRELKGAKPSLMVSNGQKLWIYYPSFNEAELYVLGQRAFFDSAIEALTAGLNFQSVEQYYRYTASKEANGYRLDLTPKSSALKRFVKSLAVYVDDQYRVTRTVADLPKGDQVTTTYRNQKPVKGGLPGSTFDYNPPSSAHISQPLGK
jgi:chaperone LolA